MIDFNSLRIFEVIVKYNRKIVGDELRLAQWTCHRFVARSKKQAISLSEKYGMSYPRYSNAVKSRSCPYHYGALSPTAVYVLKHVIHNSEVWMEHDGELVGVKNQLKEALGIL